MTSATEAPSAQNLVGERPIEAAEDAAGEGGETAGAAMTTGTGVLTVVVDITDC